MNVRRGDVVLVDFPFPSGAGSKVRPALVVQNDRDNSRLLNTIIAQITSTTHRALEPTQVLIAKDSAEGRQSGLLFDSVVNCINLLTLEKRRVLRRLGALPDPVMQNVNEGLRNALALR